MTTVKQLEQTVLDLQATVAALTTRIAALETKQPRPVPAARPLTPQQDLRARRMAWCKEVAQRERRCVGLEEAVAAIPG